MSFTVSINPTYLCNFRCQFCYLTEQQLSDKQKLQLPRLQSLLEGIQKHRTITHVDIYGGEVSILPRQYQVDLVNTIRTVTNCSINVVTNFLKDTIISVFPNVTTSVSYDFEHRERHQQVFNRIKRSAIPLHVLVLATQQLITDDVDQMIKHLNSASSIQTVEIKPYSTNQANKLLVTNGQYEQFIKQWIQSPVPKLFEFVNEREIQNSISGIRNSFSDDHIYITPNGQYAVLDFDLNDNEFFRIVDTFEQYLAWTLEERDRVFNNQFCGNCQYLGRCLTEHLRDVKHMNDSCNGYVNLIRWYKNERMENSTRSFSPYDRSVGSS